MGDPVASVAVLIVSDTCATSPELDKTGPALRTAINSAALASTVDLQYVSDDTTEISARVQQLVDDEFTAIFTAGGTGFAVRDNTPEAVKPLLQKEAPGLVAAMLQTSLSITPFAALARPVAGTINDTLVITLPGSPKGAVENFEAIASVLPHALKLVKGVSSRGLHARESGEVAVTSSAPAVSTAHAEHTQAHVHDHSHDHSHHHHHHHHHHGHDHGHVGPKFYGPAFRHRQSPYAMTDFDEAVNIVLNHAIEPVVEEMPLDESLGCVVSKDIRASVNIPAFRASIVDGYAIFHTDCGNSDSIVLPISIVSVAASELFILKPHTCARVTTGAPVPHGATAVVPVENTEVVEEKDGEEVRIKISATGVNPGDNIRGIGSDIAIGDLVLPRGTIVSELGGEIGVLATLGMTEVPVFRKPVVGVLSTGDEVVDAGGSLTGSQIWDSNRPMLLANLRSWLSIGGVSNNHVVDLGIAKDSLEGLQQRISSAFERVDILITSGGVSMGELDLLKPVVTSMGGTIHFGRVAMKPGKPVTFATFPDNKIILALPGNPSSCIVCLHLFAYPLISKIMGKTSRTNNWIDAVLGEDVKLDPRPEFQRGLVSKNSAGIWTWENTGFQRSSNITSMVRANSLARLPAASKAQSLLAKGTVVKALLLELNK